MNSSSSFRESSPKGSSVPFKLSLSPVEWRLFAGEAESERLRLASYVKKAGVTCLRQSYFFPHHLGESLGIYTLLLRKIIGNLHQLGRYIGEENTQDAVMGMKVSVQHMEDSVKQSLHDIYSRFAAEKLYTRTFESVLLKPRSERNIRVKVTLNPSEYEMCSSLAQIEGIPIATLFREHSLFYALMSHHLPHGISVDMDHLVVATKSFSNEVNQKIRSIHTEGSLNQTRIGDLTLILQEAVQMTHRFIRHLHSTYVV